MTPADRGLTKLDPGGTDLPTLVTRVNELQELMTLALNTQDALLERIEPKDPEPATEALPEKDPPRKR